METGHLKFGDAENFDSKFNLLWDQIEYRELLTRTRTELPSLEDTYVLAVDAVPTHGGGALYFPESNICRHYRINFKDDLGINVDENSPTKFEMLNLLFALCIWKQSLINLKYVRLIVDNEKYRQPKGCPIALMVRNILRKLKEEGVVFVNEVLDFSLLEQEPEDDRPFYILADRISRGKVLLPPICHSWYLETFRKTLFYSVPPEHIDKFKYIFTCSS